MSETEVTLESVAVKVMDFCRGRVPAPTVDEIATYVESDHGTVTTILDQFVVNNGQVEHVGPGMGGGWVPEVEDAVYGRPGDVE